MPLAGTQSIPAISKPQFGTKSLADRSCNLIRGSLDKATTSGEAGGFGVFAVFGHLWGRIIPTQVLGFDLGL